MTDITELTQSLKAAAEKATPGEWVYFPKNTSIEYDVGSDESQGSILYVDSGDFTQAQTDRNGEFIALANPANILALVEALEKAQQRIDELLPSNRNMLMPALGGLSRDHLVVTIQTVVDNYSALHTKWLEDRQRIAELESRSVKLPEPFKLAKSLSGLTYYYADEFQAQPAPVVQENSDPRDAFEAVFPMPKHAQRCGDGYAVTSYGAWTAYEFVKKWEGWNACRAAMLQESQKSAGTEAICRSDENVQVLHTKSPAQSDCCPAQNVVVPAQSPIDHGYLPECECSGCKATARICTEMAVNSLVIPNEMTSEQAYEIGYYYGDPVNVFARGANWMRQHIIDSTLAAAPQLPGSEPATVPGKWIPVSERMPEDSGRYWCYVEEQNDLGKSHYQWNCSWNGDRWWVESEGGGIVTHWMPLPAAPQEVK